MEEVGGKTQEEFCAKWWCYWLLIWKVALFNEVAIKGSSSSQMTDKVRRKPTTSLSINQTRKQHERDIEVSKATQTDGESLRFSSKCPGKLAGKKIRCGELLGAVWS